MKLSRTDIVHGSTGQDSVSDIKIKAFVLLSFLHDILSFLMHIDPERLNQPWHLPEITSTALQCQSCGFTTCGLILDSGVFCVMSGGKCGVKVCFRHCLNDDFVMLWFVMLLMLQHPLQLFIRWGDCKSDILWLTSISV